MKISFIPNPLFYATSLILSLLSILLAAFLLPVTGITSVFLMYISLITTANIIAGIRAGLIVTGASSISSAYFSLLTLSAYSEQWFMILFELCLYVLTAILVNVAIERYRRTDIRADFKKKEQTFMSELERFTQEQKKAQKEIRLRDEFLSIASHELKTPLTSMLLKLQLVLHNIKNVSLANFSVSNLLKNVETAEEQSKRLSRMINDLLNVSLITTGKLNLEKSHEDLVPIIKEVVDEFTERLEKHKMTIHLKTIAQAPVYLDKLRIQQVFTNLISNAIKYGDNKPIQIEITQHHKLIKTAIKDQGLGIPTRQQERIFALFERGTINHDIKGLGVGLYIASQIVKAHDGTITVKSKPGKGSVFEVELPASETKKKD